MNFYKNFPSPLLNSPEGALDDYMSLQDLINKRKRRPLYVYTTKNKIKYETYNLAGKDLHISINTIRKFIDTGKIYKKKY